MSCGKGKVLGSIWRISVIRVAFTMSRGKVPVVVMLLLVAVCTGLQTTSSPHSTTGTRCCWNEAKSDICSTSSQDPIFSPLVLLPNRTTVPSDQVVTWLPTPLVCSQGYQKQYFSVNERPNILYISGEEVKLAWREVIYKSTTQYCVEEQAEGGYHAAICRPVIDQLCGNSLCVAKCCDMDEDLYLKSKSCRPAGSDNFALIFHTLGGDPTSPSSPPVIVDHIPDCDHLSELDRTTDHKDHHYLLANGQLYDVYSGTRYDLGSYCVDYNADKGVMVALVCLQGRSTALVVKDWLQTVGVAISAIFLGVTVCLHLAIPRLRDVQGLCLFSHMVSLLVADVALFISYVSSDHLTKTHCIINGMIQQFFFLAAFFWLNIMCLDIWRVIRATVKLVPLSGILANDKKKFRIYSGYAWGGPAVMTIITVSLHHAPESPGLLPPDIGKVSCFFYGDMEILSYFYGLVAFLFAINLIFLGHTISMLYKAGNAFQCFAKEVSVTTFNRHHLRAFWQRFSLFTVMAVCWITEILSWKIPPPELWILTDVLNSLQGFMVFVIFMSSRKKRELVKTTVGGAMSTITSTVRKLSTPDGTTVTWHANQPLDSNSTQESQCSKDPPASNDQ